MKEKYLLEKLLTKDGTSSIFMVILVTSCIVFLIMPIWALTFEHALLRIAYDDIADQLDLMAYQVILDINIKDLSHGHVEISSESYDLNICHPQIHDIKVLNIDFNSVTSIATFEIYIEYQSTLYNFFDNKIVYHEVYLPIDR